MNNNKIQLSDGTVLIDLTGVSVTPETLWAEVTAIDSSGKPIIGTANMNTLARQIVNRTITAYEDSVVTHIRHSALRTCTSLTKVSCAAVTYVGEHAFAGDTSLTNVTLPLAAELGAYAFQSCTALTRLDFPRVKTIRSQVFSGCSNLKVLILRRNEVAVLSNTNAFSGVHSSFAIYVTDAFVSSYKSANNWSTYADKIFPLSALPS